MLEKLLRTTEKLIPKKLYTFGQPVYHYLLSLVGAVKYGFPSKELTVIGITGTKGKTTTTELVASILQATGEKVAMANSIHFVINDEDERNMYKMSMPGRFFMQHFLRRAVTKGCKYAVVEITSEGAKQFRHKWIYLDAFIFTNLAPEHIESHGSYENYRAAKVSITETLNPKKTAKKTILIANGDDEEVEAFTSQPAGKVVTYSEKNITNISEEKETGFITMQLGKTTFYTKLHGRFNSKNILAAVTLARELGISEETIKEGIEGVTRIPGRAEQIIKEPFEVYVDYAHTPDSLEALYSSFPGKQKVCVLGNTGGGRDTWKRPEMARIADKYCDTIILTDEDPYDEDPQAIIDAMKPAIETTPLEIIMSRRNAINQAMKLANKNKKETVVFVTGKGTDPYIMRANGAKEPWSDAEVVREEFENL
jgi:UDP-N-acetylmuramoyl-L-alanyl-D-glutamate--2,6-diaminopimelate ligase